MSSPLDDWIETLWLTKQTFVYIYHMAAFAQPSTGASPVRREAKLFEAGDYPDKGVTVLPEDLADLAARFQRPVPILIEHTDSPLALGFLESVRADGTELFGTVALSEEANCLIEQSGADSLSLGLSPDLREIQEVSLVRHPRVPSARLFAGPIFHTKLPTRKTEADWQARAEAAERVAGGGPNRPRPNPVRPALARPRPARDIQR